jgi:nucleoid DNA-binding protein
MIDSSLTQKLMASLDCDEKEALRLLKNCGAAMVHYILASKKIAIKGLGVLTVRHIPLKKERQASGVTFVPPSNNLVYERREVGEGDIARLAISALSLSEHQAMRFSEVLASYFTVAFTAKQEITLPALGAFYADADGLYGFHVAPSFTALLNREYCDLADIVVPVGNRWGLWQERFRALRPAFITVGAAGVLFTASLLLYRWFSEHPLQIVVPSTVSSAKAVKQSLHAVAATASSMLESSTERPVTVLPTPSFADSLQLERGAYAVVLATFQTERTAYEQVAVMRQAGIEAFVWPVFMEGTRYSRIMTGMFTTREAAEAHLKMLPEAFIKGAYVQKAKRNVVLYAKKRV